MKPVSLVKLASLTFALIGLSACGGGSSSNSSSTISGNGGGIVAVQA